MAVSKIKPIAENVSDKFTINAAWTNQRKKAWKIGNLVFFQLSGVTSSYTANYMYDFATIDSSIQPKTVGDFVCHKGDSNFNLLGLFEVHINSTSNKIQVNTSNTSGNYWYVNGWYEV